MAKWYRLSLSLAAKCRIGFAAAVFLIIGAALILPYRWMDKLVEQGKLELAQTQVQHLLERHFRPVKEVDPSAELVPLALTATPDDQVTTARWQATAPENNTYQIAPITNGSGRESAPDKILTLQPRPVATWIAIDSQLNQLAMVAKSETPDTLTELQKEAKAQIKTQLNNLTKDAFIIEGIQNYLQSRETQEVFRLHKSARYLRGVWAGRDCLTSGCHHSPTHTETASDQQPTPFIQDQLIGVISVTLPPGQTGPTLLFNRLFIIIGGFFAGICAMITFYIITQKFILQPVRSLRSAAHKITLSSDDAEQGDSWEAAIVAIEEIKTGDEFEKLANAFREMLEHLRKTQNELRGTNRALDLQVDKLAEQNVALFESNRLKSEFLANVSHELKTPLNAIIGFTEILKEKIDPQEDQKQSRYIDNVLSAGKMLHHIINDLLDLAKLEAGKMQVYWDHCAVGEIVETLIDFNRPMAQHKNIELYMSIDETLGLVQTDPGKLHQILFNLISNAIKFTPQGGRIDVIATDLDPQTYELSITDTGIGIAPEDQEKVFDKFLQLDGSMTREQSGTGLGLAIVKELVEMLGGTITLISQLHQGSTFQVQLPKQTRTT